MFKRVRTLLPPSRSTRLMVAALAVMLTAASFEMGPSAVAGQPLTAQQRIERSRYFAHRLGLDLGVPQGARSRAVEEMRRMELALPSDGEVRRRPHGLLSDPSR
jgi:hypothetical protein